MVEGGFPNTHTTTTTVQPDKPSIHLDLSYIKTKPGLLKCAEILFNILGFICILASVHKTHSRGNWFGTVSMTGFWFTGIMLVLYIFHVTERLSMIPWAKIEFCFCVLWTLFYLIAASLVADSAYGEAFAVAAFFGFVAMVLYGCDAFLNFIAIKEGRNSSRTNAAVGASSPN